MSTLLLNLSRKSDNNKQPDDTSETEVKFASSAEKTKEKMLLNNHKDRLNFSITNILNQQERAAAKLKQEIEDKSDSNLMQLLPKISNDQQDIKKDDMANEIKAEEKMEEVDEDAEESEEEDEEEEDKDGLLDARNFLSFTNPALLKATSESLNALNNENVAGVIKVPAHRPSVSQALAQIAPHVPGGLAPAANPGVLFPGLAAAAAAAAHAPNAAALSPSAAIDYSSWLCRPLPLPGYLPIPPNILAARLGGKSFIIYLPYYRNFSGHCGNRYQSDQLGLTALIDLLETKQKQKQLVLLYFL